MPFWLEKWVFEVTSAQGKSASQVRVETQQVSETWGEARPYTQSKKNFSKKSWGMPNTVSYGKNATRQVHLAQNPHYFMSLYIQTPFPPPHFCRELPLPEHTGPHTDRLWQRLRCCLFHSTPPRNRAETSWHFQGSPGRNLLSVNKSKWI